MPGIIEKAWEVIGNLLSFENLKLDNIQTITAVFGFQLMLYGYLYQSYLLVRFGVGEFAPHTFGEYLSAAFSEPRILILALGIDILAYWQNSEDNTSRPEAITKYKWKSANLVANLALQIRFAFGNAVLVCVALAVLFAFVWSSYHHNVLLCLDGMIAGGIFFGVTLLCRLLFMGLASTKVSVAMVLFFLAMCIPLVLAEAKKNSIATKSFPDGLDVILADGEIVSDVLPLLSNSHYSFFVPITNAKNKQVNIVLSKDIKRIRPCRQHKPNRQTIANTAKVLNGENGFYVHVTGEGLDQIKNKAVYLRFKSNKTDREIPTDCFDVREQSFCFLIPPNLPETSSGYKIDFRQNIEMGMPDKTLVPSDGRWVLVDSKNHDIRLSEYIPNKPNAIGDSSSVTTAIKKLHKSYDSQSQSLNSEIRSLQPILSSLFLATIIEDTRSTELPPEKSSSDLSTIESELKSIDSNLKNLVNKDYSNTLSVFIQQILENQVSESPDNMRVILGECYFARGINLYKANRMAQALSCMNEAIRFDSNRQCYFLLRSVVKCRCGNGAGAMDDLSLALTLRKTQKISEEELINFHAELTSTDRKWLVASEQQFADVDAQTN